jgi:Rhs element Vgr protein
MTMAPVHAELHFHALPTLDLVLGHYTVDDGLSRPTVMDVMVHVHNLDSASQTDFTVPGAWLGQRATLTLSRHNDPTSPAVFAGVVNGCTLQGIDADGVLTVALSLVHPLGLMAHSLGSEVFVDRSAIAIVTHLIATALPAAIDVRCTQELSAEKPIPLVLRYRESLLDVCHRLLRDIGVGYSLWQNDAGQLQMTLFRSLPQLKAVRRLQDVALPHIAAGGTQEPCVHTFSRAQSLVAPCVELTSFDATQRIPTTHNVARTPLPWPDGVKNKTYTASSMLKRAFADGRYTSNAGPAAVQYLADQAVATAHRGTHATSNTLALIPGVTLSMETPIAHPNASAPEALWVTDVTHVGDAACEDGAYSNHVALLPQSIRYSPHYVLPQAIPMGLQSATVMGSAGSSDPYVDDAGRIYVRLAWPALQADGENIPAFWARVAQGWAGDKMGTFFWPRPGMEVLLGFMGAHNEEPVVLSCAYNATNSSPICPQAAAGVSGIRSESLHAMGGTSALLFDDTASLETVSVLAHRHLKTQVGDTAVTTVGEKLAFDRLLQVASAVPMPMGSKTSIDAPVEAHAVKLVAGVKQDAHAHALREPDQTFWTGEKKRDVAQAALALMTPDALINLPAAMVPLAQGALATARCVANVANTFRKQPWAMKLSVFGHAMVSISQDVLVRVTGETQVACDESVALKLQKGLALAADDVQVKSSQAIELKALETIHLDAQKRAVFTLGAVTLTMEDGTLTVAGANINVQGDAICIQAKDTLILRGGKVAIN